MLIEVKQIPIAETFHSLQGEGFWVGTPMHFVRLAGCPVGAAATKKYMTDVTSLDLPILSTGREASQCQTWDGRYFSCDTDFSCHTHKTSSELVGETWEHHICLTGGEPLIHQKLLIEQGFFQNAFGKGVKVHIETSGTVDLIPALEHETRIWVTVAPKSGCLPHMLFRADEIKLLVDEHFSPTNNSIHTEVMRHRNVFLCPVNGEKEVNQANVKLCEKWLRNFPNWRLSAQYHKFLGMR